MLNFTLDFIIDHFNGIMNSIAFVLICFLIYMFFTTDMELSWREAVQMIQVILS